MATPLFCTFLRLLADVGQYAAIYIQDVPVDEVGSIRCQEYCRSHQILQAAPACRRGFGDEKAVKGMAVLAQGSGLGSCDVAGANAVALDVAPAELRADVTGEHFQAPLGSGVGRNRFPSQFAHHGTNVDDLSMSLLQHGRDHRFGAEKGGGEIHIDNFAKILRAHFQHGNPFDDAGVVDQNINEPYFFFDSGDHSLHLHFVRYIAHIAMGLNSGFLISGKPPFDAFPACGAKGTGGSGFGKGAIDRKANAVRAARH